MYIMMHLDDFAMGSDIQQTSNLDRTVACCKPVGYGSSKSPSAAGNFGPRPQRIGSQVTAITGFPWVFHGFSK